MSAIRRMREFMARKGKIPEAYVAEREVEEDGSEVDPGESIPSPVHGQREDKGYYSAHDENGGSTPYFEGGEASASGITPGHDYDDVYMFEGGEAGASGISAPEHATGHEIQGQGGAELDNEHNNMLLASQFPEMDQFAYGGMAQGGRMRLGGGGRFEKLSHELAGKGAHDPKALAAYIGRKALGKEHFQKLAAKGRARAAHMAHGGRAEFARAIRGCK